LYREEKGYSQAEFAFLIGRQLEDVQDYEDLTMASSYNLNHVNFYARILGKVPGDFVFKRSLPENDIRIRAAKTVYKYKVVYRGERKRLDGLKEKLPSYEISTVEKVPDPVLQEKINLMVLGLLENGYFKAGKTGYDTYRHCTSINEAEFMPQLLMNALAKLTGKRSGLRLMPARKAPKTEETWILYQELVSDKYLTSSE
jgi:hypothetical protein